MGRQVKMMWNRAWIAVLVALASAPTLATAGGDEGLGLVSAGCADFRVTVTPPNVTLRVPDVQMFEARILCDGQDVTAGSEIFWAMPGGIGKVEPANGPQTWFRAVAEGEGNIGLSVTYQTIMADGIVPVKVAGCGRPGTSLWRAEILPGAPMALGTGERVNFTALAFDEFGRSVPLGGGFSGAEWGVDGTIGAILQEGYTLDYRAWAVFEAAKGKGGVTVLASDDTMQSACARVEIAVEETVTHFLSGKVTDETGAPLANAKVEALAVPGGALAGTTTTDSGGEFALILPGGKEYRLRVTAPDGSQVESDQILLSGDKMVNLGLRPRGPGLPNLLLLGGAGAGATLGALALIFLLGGEAARMALLVVPVALYSRIKRDRMLDHFVRGQIYGYVVDHPGATFTEIQRARKLANGVLVYHLYTLEREQFVKSVREAGRRRFFAKEAPLSSAGVLLSKFQKAILALASAQPGLSQTEIAALLGVKRQNVSYNARRLTAAGLMRLEGWGLRKKCFTVDSPASPG